MHKDVVNLNLTTWILLSIKLGFSIERKYPNLTEIPDRVANGVRFPAGVGGCRSEYLRAHTLLRPVSPFAFLEKNERLPPMYVRHMTMESSRIIYGSEYFWVRHTVVTSRPRYLRCRKNRSDLT